MKRCPQCGQTKPLSEFNKSKSRKDGHQNVCRGCQNTRDLLDYYCKPGRRESVAASRTRGRRNTTILTWYRAIKDMQPCTDCGSRYPYYVMQWDHVGSDKTFNVSAVWRSGLSRQDIEAEIAKCELVCANCHAIRTHIRNIEARTGVEPAPSELESAALPIGLTGLSDAGPHLR